jgi:hypothetical protein
MKEEGTVSEIMSVPSIFCWEGALGLAACTKFFEPHLTIDDFAQSGWSGWIGYVKNVGVPADNAENPPPPPPAEPPSPPPPSPPPPKRRLYVQGQIDETGKRFVQGGFSCEW